MNIAFCGLMRAGKDRAADWAQAQFGGVVLKFADPLYEMQKEIYRIAGLPFPEAGKDRKLLQYLGSDWGRAINPDIWVNCFAANFHRYRTDVNIYVTDCRFENEFNLLKKLGFKMVYIFAPDDIRIARGASSEQHISESFMREVNKTLFDTLLVNNTNNTTVYNNLLAEKIGPFFTEQTNG